MASEEVLLQLAKLHDEIKQFIFKEISRLPFYEKECECKTPIQFDVIKHEFGNEVSHYCLHCGGYVKDYGDSKYDE